MSCPGKTYGAGTPLQFYSQGISTYFGRVWSEHALDRLPCDLVNNGMTPAEAKQYIIDNLTDILARQYVVYGSILICDAALTPHGTPTGFIGWFEYPPVADFNNPVFVKGGAINSDPLVTFTENGTWDAFEAQSFASIGPSNFYSWDASLTVVTSLDVNAWFDCAYGACSSGGSTPGPHFLIPRPDPLSLTPGQMNSSTPALKKMVFLSNYTFQFVNNFGRVRQ